MYGFSPGTSKERASGSLDTWWTITQSSVSPTTPTWGQDIRDSATNSAGITHTHTHTHTQTSTCETVSEIWIQSWDPAYVTIINEGKQGSHVFINIKFKERTLEPVSIRQKYRSHWSSPCGSWPNESSSYCRSPSVGISLWQFDRGGLTQAVSLIWGGVIWCFWRQVTVTNWSTAADIGLVFLFWGLSSVLRNNLTVWRYIQWTITISQEFKLYSFTE